jgi:hypothetical protein
MKDFNKYKLLSKGKAFGDRAKIALLLLDSSTAYEELKDEGAQTSVDGSYGCIGGDPASILSPVLKSEVADKASINIEYKKGSKKSENIYYRR